MRLSTTALLITTFLVMSGCQDTPEALFQKLVQKFKTTETAPQPTAAPTPATTPAPLNAPSGPVIGGVYTARGSNPNGGGNYNGTATIIPVEGNSYRMEWSVGTSYTGQGQRTGNTLSIAWGDASAPVGKVDYIIESDGTLKGTWYTYQDPNNLGTETLTPQK